MRVTNAAPLEKNSKFWSANTTVAGPMWARRAVHEALGAARRWRTRMWVRVQQ